MSMKNTIQLTKLRIDGGTQQRVTINRDVVAEYAERMKAGDEFPAVSVFHDGNDHWLADGFHRFRAAEESGAKTIACEISQGTVRDAILLSCSINGNHGLRRTNADKRKAVSTLISDEEWSKNSDRWIAEQCGVGNQLVGDVRRQLCESHSSHNGKFGKDGKKRRAAKPRKTIDKTKVKAQLDRLREKAAELEASLSVDASAAADREPGDDTEAIEADKAQRRSNGRQVIDPRERKAALSGIGVAIRFCDKAKVYDALKSHFEAILAGIKGTSP